MSGTYGDAVTAALRAEADAARAQIRAAGIVCPSCGVNMADLPDGHALVIYADTDAGWNGECRDGAPVSLSVAMDDEAALEKWQAAVTVAMWGEARRREAAMVNAVIFGEKQPEFTGLRNDWTPPPEVTDCPFLGYAAVDDFRYDMCVCGKRHVTVTACGPDDRPL